MLVIYRYSISYICKSPLFSQTTRKSLIDNTSIKSEEERTIEVSFSSEFPYNRGGIFEEEWIEILGHTEKEVNLQRLNSKAPILYNHMRFDKDSRIGVVEKAWLERGRGRAIIKISKRKEIDGIWQDIKDGILSNVSVGYTINKKELIGRNSDGINEFRVTSWTPTEISMVDIPADYSVGIGRSEPLINDNNINKRKEINMDKNQNPNPNETIKEEEQNPNGEIVKNRSLDIDIPKKIRLLLITISQLARKI